LIRRAYWETGRGYHAGDPQVVGQVKGGGVQVSRLLAELQRRWDEMFAALAAGDDLPPGRRLRAEGLMEAAVLLGEASATELDSAMDRSYRDAFGRSIGDEFGREWRDFHPFPEIPAMARRAPVYPSAPD
jgi:hypothetical protein